MLKKNKSMMKKTVLGAVIAMCCTQALAADYADGNIRKNDFNWMQMNLMQSVDAKVPYGIRNDTYLELEFGARSGIINLYGYVDFFDILDCEQDDRHGGITSLPKYLHVFPSTPFLIKIYPLGHLTNSISQR